MSVLNAISFPRAWTRVHLGVVTTRVVEPGFGTLEPLSVFLGEGVIPRAQRDDNHNELGADLEKYQRVLPGDLVFNKLRTWQGGFGVSRYTGIVSPAYIIARPTRDVDPKFLHHFMRSDPVLAELTRLSKWMPPSQFDIAWEDIRSIEIALPPMEEQRRIAYFLDDQVARIEELIRLRTSQICLLEQAWQAQRFEILSQAAAGASLRRVGSISLIHSGAGFPVDEQGLDIGDLPFIKVADLSSCTPDGTLETAANFVSSLTARKLGARPAPPGTILFPKVGAALLTNRRALLGVPAVFDNNVMGVRFTVGEPRYFLHAMSCVDLGPLANPGPVPSVNESTVKEIQIAVPHLAIQQAAIRQLDEVMGATANGAGLLNTSLSILKEYKHSLITAAVTGEFDVTTARWGIPA